LLFYTHTSGTGNTFGTTFTEKMRLGDTGNLSVVGNIKTDGVVNWNGTNGALSYGGGAVTMETNSAIPILLKTNGTTAITISTGQAVTFAGDSTFTGVANFNNEVRAGAYALSSLNYIDGTAVPLSTRRFRASQSRTNNDNGAVGLDLTNLQSTNGVYSPIISFSSTTSGGVYNCTYAAIWGVKTTDEGSWAAGDLILGTANPYGVTSRLRITAAGSANFSGAVSTTLGLNSTKNIVAGEATPLHLSYSSSDGSGPAVRFGGAQGFWDIQPSSNNQRISFEWSDTINTLSLLSDGRVGITDTDPSRRLSVNFGTSVNDGLIVYGSQRQNTVFRSTGEHCFLYIDSHHNNTFLPRLHFQRSSTTFGDIGLERASNSDAIGSFTESEMVVGSSTSVPFSLKTNGVRRVIVQSNGNVNTYGALTVSGNFGARNFVKAIKSWSTNGSYNWADEFAAISSAFDSACWYKGFIRESNGAHYYGYYFDIFVGQIGYGGNSSQFIVRNMTFAGGPWTGGCGASSFAAIDNSGFTKQNSGCFDSLELFITRLG